jgi:hypothetical protein
MPQETPFLGIDLGTTNSVAAYVREGRAFVVGDEQGRSVVPSIVSEKTTRARYSRFTWCTMPVSGGTTWKLRNARCPHRRNA